MTLRTSPLLTAAQVSFADAHRATAGMHAPNGSGVFFYRNDGDWVHRWLVDAQGNVRDEAGFRGETASRDAP
jgi:hypothetical protein